MVDKRISDFLKGLDIKTVKFGGFDKTDTFENMKALSNLYEQIFEENKKEIAEQEQPKPDGAFLMQIEENKGLKDKIQELEAQAVRYQDDSKKMTQCILSLTQQLNEKEEELMRAQHVKKPGMGEEQLRQKLEAAGALLAEIKERKKSEELRLSIQKETMLRQTQEECERMKTEAIREVVEIEQNKERAREEFRRMLEQMKTVVQSFDEDQIGN